jgi:integrase
MSINKVVNDKGRESWTVYVSSRSSIMPHIRYQKRVKGLKSRAEAVRKEKSLLKELSMKVAHQEGHGFTWRMVIEKWIESVSSPTYTYKQYSPSVLKDYYGMMYRWTKDWLNRPASEINRGDGRKVLDAVIRAGRSKAHQKKIKNTINMIYNWGIEERLISNVHNSPVYGLQIVTTEDKRPEILKVSEIRTLLYEAKVHNNEWYPVWAVALLTGMRNGELYALKWEDVDLDNSVITVQRSYNKRAKVFKSTKAGYWRSVPVSNDLKEVILDLKKTSKSEFVLPRLKYWERGEQAKVLRSFCSFINIQSVKFHTLRACFATQLLGDGVEPMKVMKVCGWRDLKTMARYVRLAGIDEKGVTDNLKILPSKDTSSGNVVSMFNHRKE